MKLRMLYTFLICAPSLFLHAQEIEVKDVLHYTFWSIKNADTTKLGTLLHENFRMTTISDQGNEILKFTSANELKNAIISYERNRYYEKIWNYDLDFDGSMASAWLPYSLYDRGELLHCGTNHIKLIKTKNVWKILEITDTRNSQCKEEDLKVFLDDFIDRWHEAAATSEEDTFFEKMAINGFYLGTDASEKWYAHELKSWSKKYFERDSAWTFTKVSREWHFHSNLELAWFDEILDTWMGKCRGSGIISLEHGKWKIQQYELSILIPNDLVNEFLKLKTQGN